MAAQKELVNRFIALKTGCAGNREKKRFEHTFGRTVEEGENITPIARHAERILSELNFALQLNGETNAYTSEIDRALTCLEDAVKEDGCLTRSACARAEECLMPLAPAAKEYDVICVGHAHLDMNWMWGWQETVAATLSTFRTMLDLMKEYPDYTFMQSQGSCYRIVEEYDPAMMAEIRERIAEGRWEVTANAWVETDKNMPDEDLLLHHVSETREYLKNTWGLDPDKCEVDFSPDTFGHSRFIPEINRFAGVKYYYHCRGLKEDHVLYRYRAPSGSEILMYREPYWYNSGIAPYVGTGAVNMQKQCAGLRTSLIVYGVGDHGGGPTRRDIERVLEMQGWPVFPRVRFGTLHEYFHAAESVRDALPVVDHEVNAIFPGCYTTQSRLKKTHARAARSLSDAASVCALAGREYPYERLSEARKNVLFTHFHDILTGSCVQDSREYAMGLLQQAMAHTQTLEGNALRELAEASDTSCFEADDDIRFTQSEGAGVGVGVPVDVGTGMGYELGYYRGVPNPERGAGKTRIYTVFNLTDAEKDEPAELTVWDYAGDMRRISVIDARGNELPFEIAPGMPMKYWDHRYITMYVRVKVPPRGYTVLAVREKEADEYPTYVNTGERVMEPMGKAVLENVRLRAVIDNNTGCLVSLTDKQTGREMITAPAGVSLIDSEKATSDAWRIGRYLKISPVTDTVRFESYQGTLRRGVRVTQKVMHSTVITTYSLEGDSSALRADIEVDWNESAFAQDTVPVLTYRLPARAEKEGVLCDVPAGFVTRGSGAIDIPCLTFAAVDSGSGYTALASDSKHGFRYDEGVLTATLLNTACEPDPYPERGRHSMTLWIRAGEEKKALLKKNTDALIRPLIAMPTGSHRGEASEKSLLRVESGSSVVSSVEKTRCGKLVLRVYEAEGLCDRVTAEFDFAVGAAQLTDMRGEPLAGEVKAGGKRVSFTVKPFSLAQILVTKA